MRDGYGGGVRHSGARGQTLVSRAIVAKSVMDLGKTWGLRNWRRNDGDCCIDHALPAPIKQRNQVTIAINHNGWDITS